MNNQEKQLLPCPECGGRRYCAQNRGIEISSNLGYSGSPLIDFNVVICSNCGYTTFYASKPMEQIARLEEDLRRDQERLQKLLAEDENLKVRKKKGFFNR